MPTSITDTLKTACDTTGAAYALYWAENKGKLCVAGVYADACMDFCAKSFSASVAPNEGIVGRVFSCKGEEVIYDVDAVEGTEFKRKAIAKECGISTVACVYVDGGVLEYGSPTNALRRLPQERCFPRD
mmetsp:Transcript_89079/g.229882  ORF Transcript_89079/g.229882 Transcript_89079/m.229882 type:complete len:129 (-) Transcript_89079:206-592(-)